MTPPLLWCGCGDNLMCWLFTNRMERLFGHSGSRLGTIRERVTIENRDLLEKIGEYACG